MASTDFITLAQDEAGRIAWNACFIPNEKDDGSLQYSVKMLFPKGGKAIKRIMALAAACKKEAFGDNAGTLESPFSDGNEKFDADPEKYAAWKDMVTVSFKSKYPPAVFDASAKPVTAMTQKEVYSGCWAVVHCNAYSWTFGKMKKGVSLGFDAIQKIKDDDRLGGSAGVQTAEQAGFSAAASEDPNNYEQDASSAASDWL